MNRVLKPTAKLVVFSFTPEQMRGYWLCHYFPKMMERSAAMIPEFPVVEKMLDESGYGKVETEKYFVKDDLQDHFLYSNKHFPQRYLSAEIRSNISSFSAFSNVAEVEQGVAQLQKDIDSGEIESIIGEYENELGDYLFLIATKK